MKTGSDDGWKQITAEIHKGLKGTLRTVKNRLAKLRLYARKCQKGISIGIFAMDHRNVVKMIFTDDNKHIPEENNYARRRLDEEGYLSKPTCTAVKGARRSITTSAALQFSNHRPHTNGILERISY